MAVRLTAAGDTITVKDSDLIAGGDEGASYTLQLLTREDYKRIRKPHLKTKHDGRVVVNEEAFGEDLLDFVLQEWSGVGEGEPLQLIECNRKNKLRIDGGRISAMFELSGRSRIEAADEERTSSFRGPA